MDDQKLQKIINYLPDELKLLILDFWMYQRSRELKNICIKELLEKTKFITNFIEEHSDYFDLGYVAQYNSRRIDGKSIKWEVCYRKDFNLVQLKSSMIYHS